MNVETCFDLGSCVCHFERHIKRIFDCKVICIDAYPPLEELYLREKKNYQMALLHSVDNLEVKYYVNDFLFGGNSMFREINHDVFPNENYIRLKTITLDTLVEKHDLPYPDFIKIDCQGSEYHILKGASKVLDRCKYLIVELQETQYNERAVLAPTVITYLKSSGWLLLAEKFSQNPADADYFFVNLRNTDLRSF